LHDRCGGDRGQDWRYPTRMTVITADDCPGASLRSRHVCQNHL